MSRVKDLGRDTAYYFGMGEGSERMRAAEQDQSTWLTVAFGVVPVLVVTFGLARVLGLHDDFPGLVAQVGLLVVSAIVWGLPLRAHRGRPSLRPPRDP